MVNIAVEGLEKDIVPIVCKMLEKGGHKVCFRHESPSGDAKETMVGDVINSKPDLAIVCNAQRGYLRFMEEYKKTASVPLLVLTGGGPDLMDRVMDYTSHVLAVPFDIQSLYDKVNTVIVKK